MYHAHFHLNEEPFGVSPDPRFFYQSEQHREALATLYYAVVQRRGLALLVGRAGLGKTSILVRLVEMLEGTAQIAYLPQPYFDQYTLLDSILLSLGLPVGLSLAQTHRGFYEHLIKLRTAGKTCVIVFDEAQNINHDTLEAVRMLSNFETPSEKMIQIVLAGQPQIAETLGQSQFEQLRQRMNSVARLGPLSSPVVLDYIQHRLRTAGGSDRLFDRDASEAVAEASGGVLRAVNTICFNALTIAYALNHPRVRFSDVAEALHDLDLTADTVSTGFSRTPAAISHSQKKASTAPVDIAAWSLRIRLPARSFRPALIAAGLVLMTAGTLFVSSLVAALR
jgi:type II secretory pathway predicted ATPase ExeA